VVVQLPVDAQLKIEYRNIKLQIESNSNITYAVAVLDKREVVTKQSQKPGFVGYTWSVVMIAHPIKTKSGNTFADDVTYTIGNAIQKSGAKVTQVSTIFSMDAAEVIDKLKATNADKLILVILDEWRSDTRPWHMKLATEMIWNLRLQILDGIGTLKAENKVEGRESGLDPFNGGGAKKIQPVTDRYYKEKMEKLFGEESIVANLK
jgi:hypothetical protein